MHKFNLYFYYKNRQAIRNSWVLESIPPKVKPFILKRYNLSNYKYIDNILRFFKFLIISLIYLFILLLLKVPISFVLGFMYFTYIGIGGLAALILFSYNRLTLENLQHDHYFRMLSENRNDLVKHVTIKRVNYAFLNWIIPLTFFPFAYIAYLDNFVIIIYYFVFTVCFYLVLSILVLTSQKLLHHTFKNLPIISDLSIYALSILSLLIPILVHFLFLRISSQYSQSIYQLIIYLGLSGLLIALLIYSMIRVFNHAITYSVTHSIIVRGKKNYQRNQIQNPSKIIKFFFGKDKRSNLLLTKDLVSFYRRDKREVFSLLILMFFAIIYTVFFMEVFISEGSIITVIASDNLMIAIIFLSFIVPNIYRYKKYTWLSCEGKNIDFLNKLGFGKYSFYKEKYKLNKIIFMPFVFIVSLIPLLFVWRYNFSIVLYIILRIPVIVLYGSLIIQYPILSDAKNPRRGLFEPLQFLGWAELSSLIFLFQIVGLSYILFSSQSETNIIYKYPFIAWIAVGIFVLILIVTKIKFSITEKNLISKEGVAKNG